MPRPPVETSAFEAFPAQEFDAWVDQLRNTIISGLEPDIPPTPILSSIALDAIQTAKREEVARAEAAARADAVRLAEEETRALQQELAARHAAVVEVEGTTSQMRYSPESDIPRDEYIGTLEQLFESQRRRGADERLNRRERSAESEDAQSVIDDDDNRQTGDEEEEEYEGEEDADTHQDFSSTQIFDQRFTTAQNFADEESVDGAGDQTEYHAGPSLSPYRQLEYDDNLVDGAGDQTEIVTRRYSQPSPIEVDLESDDDDEEGGPEADSEEGSESGSETGSEEGSEEGSDQVSREEFEEQPDETLATPVDDPHVLREKQSRHLTDQVNGNESTFEDSDREPDAPAEMEQVPELESEDDRMAAQDFRRAPATAQTYIDEERREDQDEFSGESERDGELASDEGGPAPPEDYARTLVTVRVNNQGTARLYHRVDIVSDQEDGEEAGSQTDDAASEQSGIDQTSTEDEGRDDEEIGVAQGGQYDIPARQIYLPTESLSRGCEEDAIEVDDDSDEECDQQQDTRSGSRQEGAMAEQSTSNLDNQSGEGSVASEQSIDGSDGSRSPARFRQEPLNHRRFSKEPSEVDGHESRSGDDGVFEDEAANSIIEDGDDVSVRSFHNESSYARDEGVDELADDDTHEEDTVHFSEPNRYIQPQPSDLWEASQIIDPALQPGAEVQSAVSEFTYVSYVADAANCVRQSTSSITIQEVVQSPTAEHVTLAQPESSAGVAPSQEADITTDDVQIVDDKSISSDEAEEREGDDKEITTIPRNESTPPIDESILPAADFEIAGVLASSTAAALDRHLTPLLSKATTEYEADDERSARQVPSASPSRETLEVNMNLADIATDLLSQTGSPREDTDSPVGRDHGVDGITQEDDDDELEADADVSSNGDDSHTHPNYIPTAVEETPQGDSGSPDSVAIAVQESAQLKVEMQNALIEEESPDDEQITTDATNLMESEDRSASPIGPSPAVPAGNLPSTELPESHLVTEIETPAGLHAELTGVETAMVPAAGPVEIHFQEHENKEVMEEKTATSDIASHGKDTASSPSAPSDDDMGATASPLEMLTREQAPDLQVQEYKQARSALAFDGTAEFVAIASPTESRKDELEEGEIRSGDEAADVGEEMQPCDTIVNDSAVEGEISMQNDEGIDQLDTSGSQEEGNQDLDADDLPSTTYANGIRCGLAEVMGSQQEGVCADEIATMEEEEGDETPEPDYDADSRESAEVVHYDSDDPRPMPSGVENDGIEVDPEDPEALQAEIRSHDLSDIPHKEEHLIEEDEEYNDDEPEHHIDGRPAGYDDYDVVDETDPNDIVLFEVAERSHNGIEDDRTTEQVVIQEMELRQQPGNAVRAERDSRDFAHATIGGEENENQDEIMPSAPSPEQIRDMPSDVTRERPASSEGDVPPMVMDASPSNEKEQDESDTRPVPDFTDLVEEPKSPRAGDFQKADADSLTPPAGSGVMGDDDIFDVPSPVQPSRPIEPHASVIALLDEAELPEPPQLGRSPSPLAPESLLQHDVALAMEPTPLLHKHDHHHNVVLEESHRIHEAKRQSFVSAIASVHEILPPPDESGEAPPGDDRHADYDSVPKTEQPDGNIVQSSTSSQAPPIRPEQSLEDAAMENVDDGDDPLRLDGPFDDSETMAPLRMERTEVYVELPAMGRPGSLSPEGMLSNVQQTPDDAPTGPATPIRPLMLGVDPTRHHHGPVPSMSFSSIRTDHSDISGSPAAHTRSQCHYHKIRFGRGVFSHVVLVPHCSIGTEAIREQMGASDLGRVTKEEMGKKRDLIFGNTFTSRMTSDVEPLPDNLEHQVRQLAGSDLLREGHVWLLPLEDVIPESATGRTDGDQNENHLHLQAPYHMRSSLKPQPSSQTPDRKRKRGSSHARSISATRSDGDMAGTDQRRSHSPSRVRAPREISQIAENDEENLQDRPMEKPDEEERNDQGDARSQQGLLSAEIDDDETETGADQEGGNDMQDMSEQAVSPLHLQQEHDELEEDDIEDLPSKKRVIELENGEGPSAVKITPAPKKAGWLSWLLGRKS
ncbi:hypothetical protein QFC22_000885 [Naganishia vaughanmartiniae]|uniref:Uncharacterized protein n=1 Tax=Naganishia vaughanmartiniae TaxID=1424756 RepID=A0ACC2XJ89_9TREE|nr:hypothetical protein QFC22_000885 [Naganishia vaughanmartiniae]